MTIVGEGPLKPDLQARIDAAGAGDWIALTGHVAREQLVAYYQSAWLVVSGSLAEGWGLSLTEGAGCATPCVATDIRGHRSSVRDGSSGVLAAPERLGATIADVLGDPARLEQLRTGALAWAGELTWDASALGLTRALHGEVLRWQAG
jgi:glycosyltransferase involved in cell wall biosynthesis